MMSHFDPNIHHRRSIRLSGHDYSLSGAYFATICTIKKQCLLGEVVDSEMKLSTLGRIVEECWNAIPAHFPQVELDAFVIMPNHIHGIIVIIDAPVGAQHAAPLPHTNIMPGSLPSVIRSFKSAATKRVNNIRQTPNERFWQRNYYEHIIRNESDLNRVREYISTNPMRWEQDTEYPGSD